MIMLPPAELWENHYTVSLVRQYPKHLFVFGDNLIGDGLGGQAVIRHEPNAMGIPTKVAPSMHPSAFFKDDEFAKYARTIESALTRIKDRALSQDLSVVFPAAGLGTGLAQLYVRAPRLYRYLKDRVLVEFDITWKGETP